MHEGTLKAELASLQFSCFRKLHVQASNTQGTIKMDQSMTSIKHFPTGIAALFAKTNRQDLLFSRTEGVRVQYGTIREI